ncbi:DUF5753 domain-containing protein [Actinokineospora auranticolor]|uniref:DUF5753 domain-containing protein n=1 Tax=Actinokineospora auranticolor TaxID=155976 RepID=A0A2S6H0I4_9PSEU|nr:DUF5753 domain-containing protein [Actinokineospora auranticolor]PPK70994.1 hypothetical protein CLV40_101180 [Actinokineospora auranticolor]
MLEEPRGITTDPPDDRFVVSKRRGDEWFPEFLAQERVATRIVDGCPLVLPRLLQTADYARAVLTTKDDLDACVRARLGRQSVITGADGPTPYTAYLYWTVFERPVVPAAAMAAQARHVVALAARDNITIRVLTRDSGYTPLLDGAFTYLEFRAATPVTQFEHLTFGLASWHSRVIGGIRDTLEAADRAALDAAASADFITLVAEKWDRQA